MRLGTIASTVGSDTQHLGASPGDRAQSISLLGELSLPAEGLPMQNVQRLAKARRRHWTVITVAHNLLSMPQVELESYEKWRTSATKALF